MSFNSLRYEKTGRIARITLNRPERGNSITLDMPQEITRCMEDACLDPQIHVVALSGAGSGFCGGYDLAAAEGTMPGRGIDGSPLDPRVIAENHTPSNTWDPVIDWQMMSRNVRGFMSLFFGEKPVVCKVHGFCVAGGTDLALCSDLLVIADDAKIGYPPARVWGSPTTALWVYRLGLEKAKRLLFTGDCLNGREAAQWGLAIESAPPAQLDERFEILLERIAKVPVNQLVMMKLLTNQAIVQQGLFTSQLLGTVFDGITRHTKEGYAFQTRAMDVGFRQAVLERDTPFGDAGRSTFKG